MRRRDAKADASALTLDKYHRLGEPPGRVLDDALGTTISTYENTIKNKQGFCTFCVERLRENTGWSLTPEAEDLCDMG